MKDKLEYAMNLFELNKYDEAVQNLIELYELGYEKEQILDFLYQAFVEPNIEEFKKNYQTQADGLIEVAQFLNRAETDRNQQCQGGRNRHGEDHQNKCVLDSLQEVGIVQHIFIIVCADAVVSLRG